MYLTIILSILSLYMLEHVFICQCYIVFKTSHYRYQIPLTLIHSNLLNYENKNSRYYDRMKNVSKIVQDQKESPAERAVWWVEYVIRHNGAPHLRYSGQRLSLLQYIMVDVLIFWLGLLGVIILIILLVVKYLWKMSFRIKKTKKE